MTTTDLGDDVWRRARVAHKDAFSAAARDAVVSAHGHALRFDHSYVGSEHLLIGALDVDEALREDLALLLDVDTLLQKVMDGSSTHVEVPRSVFDHAQLPCELRPLPITPRARENLGRAVEIASGGGTPSVTPEHVTIAVLEDRRGIIASTLRPAAKDAGLVRNWAKGRVAWAPLLALVRED